MNQALEDLGDYIAGLIAEELEERRLINDELVLITRPACLCKVMRFLRDDSQCLFKLLVDSESHEVLGSTILGPRADDLIHTVATLMRYRATTEQIAELPWYHPTLSEVLLSLARD